MLVVDDVIGNGYVQLYRLNHILLLARSEVVTTDDSLNLGALCLCHGVSPLGCGLSD